jgi:hypothetical protein
MRPAGGADILVLRLACRFDARGVEKRSLMMNFCGFGTDAA